VVGGTRLMGGDKVNGGGYKVNRGRGLQGYGEGSILTKK
jgi:hypothetical protein